jgi:hypothetical protein
MMFVTSTHPQFAAQYGLPQTGPQGPFGQQPQLPGFVPIVSLVPQSLLVSLVVQSLQQAQQLTGVSPNGIFATGPGQIGQSQFGPLLGQSPYWQSPWQTTGGLGGLSPYAGAFGRGILSTQAAPHMSYAN